MAVNIMINQWIQQDRMKQVKLLMTYCDTSIDTDGVTCGCKHDDKSVDTARSDETGEITDD